MYKDRYLTIEYSNRVDFTDLDVVYTRNPKHVIIPKTYVIHT